MAENGKPINELGGAEIAKRRDDAIRRALNTPPQPLKEKSKRRLQKEAAEADAAKPIRSKGD